MIGVILKGLKSKEGEGFMKAMIVAIFFLSVFSWESLLASYFIPLNTPLSDPCERNPAGPGCGMNFDCEASVPAKGSAVSILPVFSVEAASFCDNNYESISEFMVSVQTNMNEYLNNSGIIHSFNFMPPQLLDYHQPEPAFDDNDHRTKALDALKNKNIPAVEDLRSYFGADIVILFVTNLGGTNGEAYAIPANVSEKAVLVISLDVDMKNHVIAHEIGHLMGAVHQPDAEGGMTPLCPFGKGFCLGTFSTIMASGCSSSIPYKYSTIETSPDNNGNTIYHNVAKLIKIYAPTIATFYPLKVLCVDKDEDNICDTAARYENFSEAYLENPDLELSSFVPASPDDTAVDNCPDVANPYEWAYYPLSELIIRGAQVLGNGYWENIGNVESEYYWQPDQDLDGIGDACDEYSENSSSPQHGYTTSTTWYNEKIFAVELVKGVVQDLVLNGAKWNKSSMVGTNPFGGYASNHRVHFCGLDQNEYCAIDPDTGECDPNTINWGNNAYCTNGTANVEGEPVTFGYSHGGDLYPYNEVLNRQMWQHVSWKDNLQEAKNLTFKNTIAELEQAGYRDTIELSRMKFFSVAVPEVYWNWRIDAWAMYQCGNPTPLSDLCNSLKRAGGSPFYYTLSSNFVTEMDGQQYMIGDQINSNYFYNRDNQYARSTRLTEKAIEVRYIGISPDSLTTDVGLRIKVDWANAAPSVVKAVDYSTETPFVMGTGVTPEGSFYAARKLLPKETTQLIQRDDRVTYAIHHTLPGETTFSVNFGQSGDWHQLGLIDNYAAFSLDHSTATVHNDTIYFAGVEDGPMYAPKLYRLLRNENGRNFHMEQVAIIPPDIGNIKLVSVAGKLIILTNNDSGKMDIYTFEANSNTFVELVIPIDQKPAARQIINTYVSDDTLYLIGGQSLNGAQIKEMRRINLADTQNATWTTIQVDLTTADTAKLIMREIDGILMMYNIYTEEGAKTTTAMEFNLATESQPTITEIAVPDIGGIEYEVAYCLLEDNGTIKGGTMVSGCTPFTHPWYKQYSIGTTVYSVAGKGNRLYVGTSSAIKVYDISDPNAMVLKSTFSTSNRIVYDLEIADGDIMYAATSKGLYKLNTANPDTLSIIGSFYSTGSYNYQYRIQLYNGNLYVGDDNGINIRSTTNFARVAYVNIGSTMDFAIANGELAMYWDAFWDSGIDIRDAATLTRKAWDYPYCSTGELTTDHEAFYLSCDGYEYRFVGLPNTDLDYFELNGDMREMQENYLYNGWVYIPDGNKVKLSTNNEVPSVCGNGIIEPGEFCDGNTEDCALLDPQQWDSGTAICNSTCTAWDTGDCYDSGC